ncbi:response regulator [Desulfocicer niacini]
MKSILWIEDEENQFDTFSRGIENYSIKRVDNYKKAIEEIAANQFDLYVVDIILPSGKKVTSKEDLLKIREIYFGIELIKHIRQQDTKTPIIVVSVVTSSYSINDKIKKIDPNISFFYKYDVDSKVIKEKITELIGD